MAKRTDTTKTKITIKTDVAVKAYNTVKGLNIMKLKKEDMFNVLRAANALKPIVTAFEDFVKDAQERLKPENFDELQQKAKDFDSLPAEEKAAVNKAFEEYNKNVNECVSSELEKEKEIEDYTHLSQDTLGEIVVSNDKLTVETILLLQTVLA